MYCIYMYIYNICIYIVYLHICIHDYVYIYIYTYVFIVYVPTLNAGISWEVVPTSHDSFFSQISNSCSILPLNTPYTKNARANWQMYRLRRCL